MNTAFEYLTPKRRLEERDLNDDQVMADSFHMVCSPKRCWELCTNIFVRRRKRNPESMFISVWEPVPDLCTPAEFDNLRSCARWAKIISPNGEEFSKFFEDQNPKPSQESMVEQVFGHELGMGEDLPAVVIREGADGSYLFLGNAVKQMHFRAYHQDNVGVVDPTGGGNAFLGALAIGFSGKVSPPPSSFIIKKRWMPDTLMAILCATVHATIAASFAIEQVGMPQIERDQPDVWNGESYAKRFSQYLTREWTYIVGQIHEAYPQHDEEEESEASAELD